MGPLERFYLRWNEYESNFKQGFSDLRQSEELFDVTIISGSKLIKAHKVILSACSPVFRSIIGSAPVQTYPLIYLRGINFYYLELLLSFMYYGEVSVGQEELDDFISIAQEFQIKGLSNYSMPRKRCESQPSTSSTVPNELTPYPPHDSQGPSFATHNINDSLSESCPNTEKKECCILDESNTLEFIHKASEQMETNKESLESISSEQNQDYDEALNREIIQHYSKQKTGKGYECKKCCYMAQRRRDMHNHVEAKHLVTRGYICSICEKKYNTKRSLYFHKYRKHKVESVGFEGPKVIN
uniref:Protein abruptlike [Bombus terrestris] n=2 Tax=Lepeophtheirus salmonis TaxID=72036 RepID=A0A0K2UZH1_LEPSM